MPGAAASRSFSLQQDGTVPKCATRAKASRGGGGAGPMTRKRPLPPHPSPDKTPQCFFCTAKCCPTPPPPKLPAPPLRRPPFGCRCACSARSPPSPTRPRAGAAAWACPAARRACWPGCGSWAGARRSGWWRPHPRASSLKDASSTACPWSGGPAPAAAWCCWATRRTACTRGPARAPRWLSRWGGGRR